MSIQTDTTVSAPTIGSVIDAGTKGRIPEAPDLWGHGGLHGGLTLAALAAAACADDDRRLRSVTGQFLRPVQHAADLQADELRLGRTVRTVAVRATTEGSLRATATVTTGSIGQPTAPAAVRPAAPSVPPPESCAVLALPDESASIVSHTEIRPATGALPFSGGEVPELVAWVRRTDDDRSPGDLDLVVLADAIAASYTATLTFLALTPTLELSVAPTGPAAVSPWVLVRTRANVVSEDGWIEESIELWDEERAHLASARQRRILIPL